MYIEYHFFPLSLSLSQYVTYHLFIHERISKHKLQNMKLWNVYAQIERIFI